MANIKLYQQLTVVILKGTDKECLMTLTPIKEFYETCEKSKFVFIDGRMINTYEIREAYPMKANDIEVFILSQDREVIKKIRDRQKEMDLAISGKNFDSVRNVISWLESKNISYTNI